MVNYEEEWLNFLDGKRVGYFEGRPVFEGSSYWVNPVIGDSVDSDTYRGTDMVNDDSPVRTTHTFNKRYALDDYRGFNSAAWWDAVKDWNASEFPAKSEEVGFSGTDSDERISGQTFDIANFRSELEKIRDLLHSGYLFNSKMPYDADVSVALNTIDNLLDSLESDVEGSVSNAGPEPVPEVQDNTAGLSERVDTLQMELTETTEVYGERLVALERYAESLKKRLLNIEAMPFVQYTVIQDRIVPAQNSNEAAPWWGDGADPFEG